METQILYYAEVKIIIDCAKLIKRITSGKKLGGRRKLREEGEEGKKERRVSCFSYHSLRVL